MKAREILNIGYKQGPIVGLILQSCKSSDLPSSEKRDIIRKIFDYPGSFVDHKDFGSIALELIKIRNPVAAGYEFTEKAFQIWGQDQIDEQTKQQMSNCMALPIVKGGAIMPDGHLGYGLPIGGVLATKDAVIPYAVGVDIACRMMLSIVPIKIEQDQKNPIDQNQSSWIEAINNNTRFGVGASFDKPKYQPVMDMDWNVSKITSQLKDLAAKQLGTSGGGNHFVDIGEITFKNNHGPIEAGTYVAILTHSGSRGPGSKVAAHYSKLAQSLHPHIPPQYKFLAWLNMSGEGVEYWAAMELMGEFASANHHTIHEGILKELKLSPLLQVENHHNFAWKETYNGEELIVHRKGATPAGLGVMGFIPGSMATPGYLVKGLGNHLSFNSASHGAGRTMSRTKAKETYRWNSVNEYLSRRRVTLLSAGLDEVPMAYKDINAVMELQSDLIEVMAKFEPRIVKMADDGTSED